MEEIKSFVNPREFGFMELQLLQPLWSKKAFELLFDNELIATMVWPTWFRSIAYATTKHGQWSIKKAGFFNPKIIIRRKGSDRNLYEVEMKNYRKGKIKLGERSFEWKSVDIWAGEMGWIENQRDIMLFKLSYSLTKKRLAKMRMIKTDFSDEELSVLMLTGLYLISNSAQHNGM